MRELRRRPASKLCMVCKEAIISSQIYCERLEEHVDNLVYCPYFEPKAMVKLHAIQ